MKKFFILTAYIVGLLSSFNSIATTPTSKKYKIGLCVMATGKYTCFLDALFKSADQYFCPHHDVTYFVFTDGQVPKHERIVRIEQKRLGWPYDTMMRFAVYDAHHDQLATMDYLFGCDADMLFKGTIGDEILGDRVATLHPGFLRQRGTYDTNPASTACIYHHEGEHYFAGGFFGGSATEFLKMARICTANIMTDLQKNYVALWHDESHLNRYFIDNKPTIILSELYCYPECWKTRYPTLWEKQSASIKLMNANKPVQDFEQWRRE